jgi:hypothetical protein
MALLTALLFRFGFAFPDGISDGYFVALLLVLMQERCANRDCSTHEYVA